jgi:RimJ/RimL family protein N-acetyltransferase
MAITIRRAAVDDWRICRDIRLRALHEEPRAYASTFEREQRLTDQEWRDRLGSALTVLALRNGEVKGMATGIWQPDGDMIIVGMYVVPDARGQGYGAHLIDEIAKAAVERGGRRLVLDIAEGNLAAERCYRKYGFLPTGRRVPMERDPSIVESRYAFPLTVA